VCREAVPPVGRDGRSVGRGVRVELRADAVRPGCSSGNEDAGFAEALVGVDGEWRGITVEAMPKEKKVIDFDLTEQQRSLLPGAGDERNTTVQENNVGE